MASAPMSGFSQQTAGPGRRRPGPAALWAARGLALAALGSAAYLLSVSISGEKIAGCGPAPESACATLLAARWSQWLRVPVTLPAVLVYAATLVALFAISCERRPGAQGAAWQMLLVVAPIHVVSACWFLGLQVLATSFCGYCITAHACGLLLAVFIYCHAPIQWRRPADQGTGKGALTAKRAWALSFLGMTGSAALVAGQLHAPPWPPDMVVRLIGSSGSTITLDVNKHPRLGKADARYAVVELFNYSCPHCRVLGGYLEQARRRYGDQLAILPLVVPLHPACNRYVEKAKPGTEHACEQARLALAVWALEPGAFESFHRWLLESERAPESAAARAAELVGAGRLAKALGDTGLSLELAQHVRIYAAFGGGQLPQLIHGRHAAVGEPASAEQVFDFLETNLGLRVGGTP